MFIQLITSLLNFISYLLMSRDVQWFWQVIFLFFKKIDFQRRYYIVFFVIISLGGGISSFFSYGFLLFSSGGFLFFFIRFKRVISVIGLRILTLIKWIMPLEQHLFGVKSPWLQKTEVHEVNEREQNHINNECLDHLFKHRIFTYESHERWI